MPVPEGFTVNIDANQIYQDSNVVSNGQLTLTIPFTYTNLTINPTIAPVTPEVIWFLDANGESTGQGDQALNSTTPTLNLNANPPTITVPMQLNSVPSGTTAVVINVTVAVGMSVVSGQNSGTFRPTCSIVQQNPTDVDVDFDVQGSGSTSASSALLSEAINFPSSFNAQPVVEQPSTGPINPKKRDTQVSVPIQIQNPPNSPSAYLQTTFTVLLTLTIQLPTGGEAATPAPPHPARRSAIDTEAGLAAAIRTANEPIIGSSIAT